MGKNSTFMGRLIERVKSVLFVSLMDDLEERLIGPFESLILFVQRMP
jgi:hypothetical protein